MTEMRTTALRPVGGRRAHETSWGLLSSGTLAPAVLLCVSSFVWATSVRAQEADAPLDVLSTDELAERRAREADPVLSCSPMALEATATQGRSVGLSVDVANAGGRSLSWRVASAPAWAQATPRAGTLGWRIIGDSGCAIYSYIIIFGVNSYFDCVLCG